MFPALKLFPFAVITLLLASCGRGPAASSGVTYQHEKVPSEPWSIHIAKIDRANADLQIRTTLARDTVLGLSTLAQQVKALPGDTGRPIAAINGDFYVVDGKDPYLGDPRGVQIMDGEFLSAPSDQATFWIDPSGQPQATNITSNLSVTWPDGSSTPMGLNERCPGGGVVLFTPRHGQSTRTTGVRELVLEPAGDGPWLPLQAGRTINARVREIRSGGDTALTSGAMVIAVSEGVFTNNVAASQLAAGATLKLSTATIPDLSGVKMAISGGYVMLRDGKKQEIQIPQSGAYKYRSVGERHPRAAIGASRDHIFLVVVDGRQPELSMGMTIAELGAYMQKIGCDLALNLDGGASATFWHDGKVLNSPCNGGDRPIANGIVVLAKPDAKR
jgi:hypothetical protein